MSSFWGIRVEFLLDTRFDFSTFPTIKREYNSAYVLRWLRWWPCRWPWACRWRPCRRSCRWWPPWGWWPWWWRRRYSCQARWTASVAVPSRLRSNIRELPLPNRSACESNLELPPPNRSRTFSERSNFCLRCFSELRSMPRIFRD